eukprot:scaffold1724_cov341-Pavlova_lutheri.AAC.27
MDGGDAPDPGRDVLSTVGCASPGGRASLHHELTPGTGLTLRVHQRGGVDVDVAKAHVMGWIPRSVLREHLQVHACETARMGRGALPWRVERRTRRWTR